ncbi:MAG: asparagine synthase-related protein, partial [Candidatus Eisenbacteria bacterium]
MSGICGVVALDGAPVDRAGLEQWSDFLRFRAPDGVHMQVRGGFGFTHASMRTLDTPQPPQPLSLDGATWITCDARIDAQSELKAKLLALGRDASRASDAQLILHAYHAWGEDCLGHLLGDFTFAIWDAPRRRLLCARDHFGVKPFFYAHADRRVVFSNTLNCVLAHPAVPRALDELAIADFLVHEANLDTGGTAFKAVRRLPPAHCLVATAAGITVKRYWSLPDREVIYRDDGEYVQRFKDLLDMAVADRVRSDRVGILMSGGLDSCAVAAGAAVVERGAGRSSGLKAFTVVYDRLIPDDERRHVTAAASALGIPLSLRCADDSALFERHEELGTFFPEPANKPFAAIEVSTAREAARHGRVILTGWDGDALMTESPRPYFRSLLRQRRLGRLLSNAMGYALAEKKLLPAGALARLNPWRSPVPPAPLRLPPWLSGEFERRLGLRERAAEFA